MKSSIFKINWGFLVATVILFVTELLIALFVKGFVRHYVGDVLVVILIYCFMRIFIRGLTRTLPLYVFLFAGLVEIGQAYNVVGLLSLESGSALAIAIGSSFDWMDMICYAIGAIVCYLHANYYKSAK
jgi:hypothetical protein